MRKLLIAGTVAVLTSGTAIAQMAPEQAIEKRQAIMKSVGAATGAAGDMVKGELAFDPRVAKAALTTYLAASHTFGDYFPEGSEEGGDTRAAPAIWEDREGFLAQVAAFREDAEAAVAADPQDLEAFQPLFGQIAQNCRACHEDYRLSED